MTRNWPTMDPPIAQRNAVLEENGISWKHLSADRQTYALKRSQLTKHMKVIVVSLLVAFPSSSSFENTFSVRNTIIAALLIARSSRARVTMGSSAFRGLARKICPSTGSTPRLWAGGPSIIMLIQRICIAFRGEGNPKAVATLAIARAAKDVDNWNAKKALILKKMPTVSFVPITIVREYFRTSDFCQKSTISRVFTFAFRYCVR